MITKIDIVNAAYEELRISGLTTNPEASEVTTGVRRLDSMMSAWRNKNLCVSYIPSESYSDIDPNQDSGLNSNDMFAVVANLAKNLCALYGKPCHPQTKADAKEGYDNLFSVVLPTNESDPYLPVGSGRSFGNGFNSYHKFQAQDAVAPDDCDTFELNVGDTDFFTVDFSRYLLEDATIATSTIEAGSGVEVVDSTTTDTTVNLECKGLAVGVGVVKITITTTTDGRKNTESIYFNVTES